MALVFTEEVIAQLAQDYNQANPAFVVNWQTYAVGTIEVGRYTKPVVLFENDKSFVLIRPALMNISKIERVTILEKEEIQGLRLRLGPLNFVVKGRMKNGDDFKLLFPKKSNRSYKRLPLNQANVYRLRQTLGLFYGDRVDMKDHSLSLGTKFFAGVAWLLIFVLSIAVGVIFESKVLAYGMFFVGSFLIGLIFSQVEKLFNHHKDRAYVKAHKALKATINQQTELEYYIALKQLTPKPQTKYFQTSYLKELIAIAHNLGLTSEAKAYLAQYPRRYSSGAEKNYQILQNLLLKQEKAIYEYGAAPKDVEQDVWDKYK